MRVARRVRTRPRSRTRATATALDEMGAGAGACVWVGTHLCGSLSPRLIDLFARIDALDGLVLCPCCLRKVCWTLGCRPVERYQALLRSFSERAAHVPQFAKDCVWIEARLALVQARAEGGAAAARSDESAAAEG